MVCGPLALFIGIPSVKYLGLIGLVYGLIDIYLVRSKKGHLYVGRLLNRRQSAVLAIVVGQYMVSFLRIQSGEFSLIGNLNLAIQVLFIVLLTYGTVSRSRTGFEDGGKQLIYQLYWALSMVIVINVGGSLLGFEAPIPDGGPPPDKDASPSLIAGLLGLDLGRTGFFLTGHPNGFGIYVGWVFIMGVLLLIYGKYENLQKQYIRFSVAAIIFALLMLDSRNTTASSIVCILLAITLVRIRITQLAPYLTWILPILSLSITVLLQYIASSGAAASVSRADGEIATGNGRTIFWEYCMEELSVFKEIHLFGWGQNGHITSGVALKYEWYLDYPAYTHNFVFQTIVDMGYLGLLSLLWLMYIVSKNGSLLVRKGYKQFIVFAVFPIYFQLSGIFEATFGQFNQPYTNTFLLMAGLSVFLMNECMISQKNQFQAPLDPLSSVNKD